MTTDADIDDILARFGLARRPPATRAGLDDLYGAWCLNVPFDNVAKTTALYNRRGGELPGARAQMFFTQWLEDGVGGTCWPTANALFALVDALGFDARRVTASMMDRPEINHGTVAVRVDGVDYLIDSSILTHEPLPLVGGRDFLQTGRSNNAEVEALDSGFRIWVRFPTYPDPIPCRIRHDGVPEQTFLDAYEASRGFGPFNHRLHVRHEGRERTTVVSGATQFNLDQDGLTVQPLSSTDLLQWLREVCGVSQRALDAWVESGCLAASMEPAEAPALPPFDGVPPSQRT